VDPASDIELDYPSGESHDETVPMLSADTADLNALRNLKATLNPIPSFVKPNLFLTELKTYLEESKMISSHLE
jgi:hypothetical protein